MRTKTHLELMRIKTVIDTEAAQKLQDDLTKAVELLNKITTTATYTPSHSITEARTGFQDIERLARQTRNILEDHMWPF